MRNCIFKNYFFLLKLMNVKLNVENNHTSEVSIYVTIVKHFFQLGFYQDK